MKKKSKDIFFRPEPPHSSDTATARDLVRGRRLLTAAILLFALLVFGLVSGAWFLFRLSEDLPTLEQIQKIEQPLSSTVYDMNGKVVHEFSIQRRVFVPIDTIPIELQNAVIAIEDRRFYHHWGINIRRIVGAILVNIVRREYAQGASTLTQQLARNLYLTADQSMIRKLREALTAVQLESCYTKEEIFELYLNQIYFGGGAWGVGAASEQYFRKPVWELDLNECATLAGIIQLPERYRPDKPSNHPRLTARRGAVLRAMKEIGFIDEAAYSKVNGSPVPSHPRLVRSNVGAYFIEMVRKYCAEKYGDDQLYNGGLSIHTTLDREGQKAAEISADSQIVSLQERLNSIFLDSTRIHRRLGLSREAFLEDFDSLYALNEDEYDELPDSTRLRQAQIAVIAVDTRNGGIRTLIGGRDFEESKFNRATMARRQPGSLFKPIVYTAALEHGFSPASVVLDQPIAIETPEGAWRPENYGRSFEGPMTIRRALARSVNLVAIQVLLKIGPQTVVDMARRMGFTHAIQPIPSLAIGSCEVTPLEMVQAYQIFANEGVAASPYFIEKIVDKTGRVIDRHTPDDREVLSPQVSYLMCSLLKSVVCCGTGAKIPAMGFTRPAGGKTGTTNNYSDAWFAGFTPQVACCVWTGVDERRSLGHGVTGSSAAIPVWVPTMAALHQNLPVEDFTMPSGIRTEQICDDSHLIATPACPSPKTEYLPEEAVIDTCTLHGRGAVRKATTRELFGTVKVTKKKKKTQF